ncbi:MAG: class I SAM-dependent methyltransferase [Ignavibacteriaceae bacterium]
MNDKHSHVSEHHHHSTSSTNDRVFNQGADRLRTPERVERLEIERVVNSSLEGKKIQSVLDIGTGSGLFAEAFQQRKLKIAGVDSNQSMVDAAKEFLPDSAIQVAPAEALPFNDNSFDLTFFGVVFHEVDNYQKAMKEAHRVSAVRTAILEWDYKEEDFGPPIEHRLRSEFVKNLAEEAGYTNFQSIKLKSLVLYLLDK